jgi:hypothetical protein
LCIEGTHKDVDAWTEGIEALTETSGCNHTIGDFDVTMA